MNELIKKDSENEIGYLKGRNEDFFGGKANEKRFSDDSVSLLPPTQVPGIITTSFLFPFFVLLFAHCFSSFTLQPCYQCVPHHFTSHTKPIITTTHIITSFLVGTLCVSTIMFLCQKI